MPALLSRLWDVGIHSPVRRWALIGQSQESQVSGVPTSLWHRLGRVERGENRPEMEPCVWGRAQAVTGINDTPVGRGLEKSEEHPRIEPLEDLKRGQGLGTWGGLRLDWVSGSSST